MSSPNAAEEPFNRAFGGAARRLRLRRGLTQRQVIERMNAVGAQMNQANLSNLEAGRRRWSSKHLAHICAALQVDPQEFIVEMLPPDAAQLVAASWDGAAGVAAWLAARLK